MCRMTRHSLHIKEKNPRKLGLVVYVPLQGKNSSLSRGSKIPSVDLLQWLLYVFTS